MVMFIYSIRASTVKFFAFVLLTAALLIGAAALSDNTAVFASGSGDGIDFSGIKDNEDRVGFIESFGIRVEDTAQEKSFKMPDNFDRVILGYNELQKKQGLDLSKYAKKKVTRYTYKVTNYNSDDDVYASLFVYRNKIVACDIASASPDGFVLPLTLVDRANLKQ